MTRRGNRPDRGRQTSIEDVRPGSVSMLSWFQLAAIMGLLILVGIGILQQWPIFAEAGVKAEDLRPFGVGFILIVALMTAIGGRVVGTVTLLLSAVTLVFLLFNTTLKLIRLPHGAPPGPPDLIEVCLVSAIGIILISAIDGLQQERAKVRVLIADAEERAAREALVNEIGQRIRRTLDPAIIEDAVTRELGRALDADRCFAIGIDDNGETAAVTEQWHRDGLTEIADPANGRVTLPARLLERLVPEMQARAIADTQKLDVPSAQLAVLRTLDIGSAIAAPVQIGQSLKGAFVVASESPREWAPAELALASAVGQQAESAIKSARIHQRERRIATVLQEALRPKVPDRVPGVELANYYQPASDEAALGGDFFDVFAVEKGRYALAIGDVSGKGLIAAAQVATVRNMLRSAIYRCEDLVAAISGLNTDLTDHQLLAGFATLFVAVFDPSSRKLVYVSCGHEPVLFVPKDGEPQELGPTGPIVGASPLGGFDSGELALGPGDTLVLFTDGVTESRPDGEDLLGTAGVVEIVDECRTGDGGPAALAQSIVDGVARKVALQPLVRDDVCLLVAVGV